MIMIVVLGLYFLSESFQMGGQAIFCLYLLFALFKYFTSKLNSKDNNYLLFIYEEFGLTLSSS